MKPGDLGRRHLMMGDQLRHEQFGQVARLHPSGLGQHHRSIGRQIAMSGIARRFDHNARRIQPGRQATRRREVLQNGLNDAGEVSVDNHYYGS
jgi:hypothetical protein